MFIPLRTDAPLYHRPWATIALIIINIVIQIWATATNYESVEPWILHYGSITPIQWITSAFLHAGWMHCIGNMIFLWVFGLVVEGKIGWKLFIPVYLAIAVFSGLIEQVIMLGSNLGSLGASGCIFGLLAMSMLWAPDNEVDILIIYGWFFTYEMTIKGFALLYIGLEVGVACLDGFKFGSAVLHLIGVCAGLPIALVMLKKGWVDCEGWDWISRSREKQIPPPPPKQVFRAAIANDTAPNPPLDSVPTDIKTPHVKPVAANATPDEQIGSDIPVLTSTIETTDDNNELRDKFFEKIKAGKLYEAYTIWGKHVNSDWDISTAIHLQLGYWLADQKHHHDAIIFTDRVLASEPTNCDAALLKAKCLLRENNATDAQVILDQIAPHISETKHGVAHRQLVMEAQTMREASGFELDL